jgi:hypothetical protein
MLGLSGVQTVWHVVQTDGTVTDGASRRDDTSSRRLTGNRKSFDSEALLNSRIPVTHLYKQAFLSEHKMRQKTNKLALWRFWDKKILNRFGNTFPVQIKNYTPFLSERDKG